MHSPGSPARAGERRRAPSRSGSKDLKYSFDDVGNLVEQTDWLGGTQRTFSYDALDRLRTVRAGKIKSSLAVEKDYKYDLLGNLLEKDGVVQSYETGLDELGRWRGGPHAISGRRDCASSPCTEGEYFYDPAGNRIAGDGKTLVWSADNMPVFIDDKTRDQQTSFVYDGQNQRVKKTVFKGYSGVEETFYSGPSTSQRHAAGRIYETTHLILNGIQIATIETVEGTATTRFHQFDHLGGTALVTDKFGRQLEAIEYHAFGTSRSDTNPAASNHKFTGQELDASAELYNYNARHYDPEIGAFISADPVVAAPHNSQSLNRYSYVLNNPLKYTDPTGNFFFINPFALLKGKFQAFVWLPGTMPVWGSVDFAGSSAGTFGAGVGFPGAHVGVEANPFSGRQYVGGVASLEGRYGVPGVWTLSGQVDLRAGYSFVNAHFQGETSGGVSHLESGLGVGGGISYSKSGGDRVLRLSAGVSWAPLGGHASYSHVRQNLSFGVGLSGGLSLNLDEGTWALDAGVSGGVGPARVGAGIWYNNADGSWGPTVSAGPFETRLDIPRDRRSTGSLFGHVLWGGKDPDRPDPRRVESRRTF